ncbi:response regulator transcription factor [Muricoccus pecuniae]|uniref:DNA-binding response OmpR family regulator n=1 Tax=Muricoccus pecuniae TaxID=693023 RepID=A0A840YCS0_9PROT|nr:response regulator transcription factor [Roseomonas pecuniae]MBB5692312.1 DNA-binding response OmpR family regulator [Roseomonas pecuniae]
MSGSRPVLVLEDDASVAATICNALVRDGWRTERASTLAEARARLRQDNPRIAVVDLGLPDGNGIAFVREAAARPDLGVIVVSGRADEVDRVVGLEVGADDYLAKPFSLREMVARVRALSRRLDAIASTAAEPQAPATLETAGWSIGGVQLEPSRLRLVAGDGTETRLTGGEAGLLTLLLEAAEHFARRETISEKVLGRRLLPEQRGVDQLASNLRHKLAQVSDGKVTVAAVRGQGYRLVW